MKRSFTILLAATGGILAAAIAEAGTCTLSTTSVSFGAYNVFTATPTDGTGQVNFQCSPGGGGGPVQSVTIHLSNGGAPSFDPRRMLRGGEILNYNLYLNAARTTIWGDGTGGTQVYAQGGLPSNSNVNINVFGRIPAGQDVSAGIYTNTVVATIFW